MINAYGKETLIMYKSEVQTLCNECNFISFEEKEEKKERQKKMDV